MKNKSTKQNKKRPVGMILLAIFLIWAFFNIFSKVFINKNFLDLEVLENYSLLLYGYIIFIVMLILNALSIYAIFTRKRLGIKILFSFLILSVIMSIFMYFLSIGNLDVLKELAFQSRIERGLSTEGIDFAVNPIILGITTFFISVFYLFLIYYVNKKRGYFNK